MAGVDRRFALLKHRHSFVDLDDVSAASPAEGDVLYWDGSKWQSTDAVTIDPDGGVALRFNGALRLQTASTGIAVSNQVTAVGTTSANDEDGSRFGRSQTQCVVFAGDGVANKIVSLSDTGTSKNLWIRATTNAAGDAGSIDPSIVFVDRQTQELGRFWGNGGLTVGSPTGGNKGIGTINATAVYDDNALLCMPVEEALGIETSREKWDRLAPTGKNALVDRHEAHKAEGWDGTAASYVSVMERRGSVPGLASVNEIEAREDRKFSIGERTEQIWLALDYLAVAFRDLVARVDALEGETRDPTDSERHPEPTEPAPTSPIRGT